MPTLSEALVTGRGTERPFNCPVHDDRNASASVNVVKGVWVCYACQASGTVDGAPPPDIETLAANLFKQSSVATHPDWWLDLFDADHPSAYWSKRFGYETATRFRCGTHPTTGEPTYPLFASTRGYPVAGVVVRTKEGDPKYRYPAGAVTSKTFFNIRLMLHQRRWKTVVLCEGATDVMAIYQAHPDIEDMDVLVLGCYGSGVHEPQRKIIEEVIQPYRIILAFDSDDAGRQADRAAKKSLSVITPKVVSAPLGTFKDVGEIPLKRRTRFVTNWLKETT